MEFSELQGVADLYFSLGESNVNAGSGASGQLQGGTQPPPAPSADKTPPWKMLAAKKNKLKRDRENEGSVMAKLPPCMMNSLHSSLMGTGIAATSSTSAPATSGTVKAAAGGAAAARAADPNHTLVDVHGVNTNSRVVRPPANLGIGRSKIMQAMATGTSLPEPSPRPCTVARPTPAPAPAKNWSLSNFLGDWICERGNKIHVSAPARAAAPARQGPSGQQHSATSTLSVTLENRRVLTLKQVVPLQVAGGGTASGPRGEQVFVCGQFVMDPGRSVINKTVHWSSSSSTQHTNFRVWTRAAPAYISNSKVGNKAGAGNYRVINTPAVAPPISTTTGSCRWSTFPSTMTKAARQGRSSSGVPLNPGSGAQPVPVVPEVVDEVTRSTNSSSSSTSTSSTTTTAASASTPKTATDSSAETSPTLPQLTTADSADAVSTAAATTPGGSSTSATAKKDELADPADHVDCLPDHEVVENAAAVLGDVAAKPSSSDFHQEGQRTKTEGEGRREDEAARVRPGIFNISTACSVAPADQSRAVVAGPPADTSGSSTSSVSPPVVVPDVGASSSTTARCTAVATSAEGVSGITVATTVATTCATTAAQLLRAQDESRPQPDCSISAALHHHQAARVAGAGDRTTTSSTSDPRKATPRTSVGSTAAERSGDQSSCFGAGASAASPTSTSSSTIALQGHVVVDQIQIAPPLPVPGQDAAAKPEQAAGRHGIGWSPRRPLREDQDNATATRMPAGSSVHDTMRTLPGQQERAANGKNAGPPRPATANEHDDQQKSLSSAEISDIWGGRKKKDKATHRQDNFASGWAAAGRSLGAPASSSKVTTRKSYSKNVTAHDEKNKSSAGGAAARGSTAPPLAAGSTASSSSATSSASASRGCTGSACRSPGGAPPPEAAAGWTWQSRRDVAENASCSSFASDGARPSPIVLEPRPRDDRDRRGKMRSCSRRHNVDVDVQQPPLMKKRKVVNALELDSNSNSKQPVLPRWKMTSEEASSASPRTRPRNADSMNVAERGRRERSERLSYDKVLLNGTIRSSRHEPPRDGIRTFLHKEAEQESPQAAQHAPGRSAGCREKRQVFLTSREQKERKERRGRHGSRKQGARADVSPITPKEQHHSHYNQRSRDKSKIMKKRQRERSSCSERSSLEDEQDDGGE